MTRKAFWGLLAIIFIFASCKEFYKPDIVVPQYIDKNIMLATEYMPTYIGHQYYPMGTSVFLAPGTFNEFYSVARYNAAYNTFVKFYWNINTPHPFSLYSSDPLFMPLQEGEMITMYRMVTNVGGSKGTTEDAGSSNTGVRRVVQVVDGKIVDDNVNVPTQEIMPGQYVPISHEFPFEPGIYQFEFTADVDNDVQERNEDNNEYVERETENLNEGP